MPKRKAEDDAAAAAADPAPAAGDDAAQAASGESEAAVAAAAPAAPAPVVSTSFDELGRLIAEELPRGSSLRRRSIERLASHLGETLAVEDFNHFARELQLAMVGGRPGASPTLPRFALEASSAEGARLRAEAEKAAIKAAEASSAERARAAQEEAEASFEEKQLQLAAGEAAKQDLARITLPTPVNLAPASAAVRALCADVRAQHPVVLEGGRAHEGNIRAFAERMLRAPVQPGDWEWAWELAGFAGCPQAARYQAGYIFVGSVCNLVAAVGDAGKVPGDAAARAALAIATLARAFFLKLSAIQDSISAFIIFRGGMLEGCSSICELLARLLVELFPQASGSSWGWTRAGWGWDEWMRMVERMLGNMEHQSAMSVLRQTLADLKGRQVPETSVKPLQDLLASCEWAQEVSGLSTVAVDEQAS